ncbi:MAG: DNA repair exonuclease [Pirellulales bacterium]|nr:DNA repair exonuclease [Pirellulales bacterium]
MSRDRLRFIHTSDLHLEQPLYGVPEVPEHLRDVFLETPYLAAERVFEAALSEQVDFVALAGDALHPRRGGPRALEFLCEQFTRLNERGIAVFWAGGTVDTPASWPHELALPPNVTVFPAQHLTAFPVYREGRLIAQVVGASRAGRGTLATDDLTPDNADLPRIAIVHGALDGIGHTGGIDYWALGGRHNASKAGSDASLAHYCGSPQGRHPSETEPHGCLLVGMNDDGHWQSRLIPTDVVRWYDERLALDEKAKRGDLEKLMQKRIESLSAADPGLDRLIAWHISARGELATQLRRGNLAADVLSGLRQKYGVKSPAAWSWKLEVEPPETVPVGWQQQQTMLGDFLRMVEQLRVQPRESLELQRYAGPHKLAEIEQAVDLSDAGARQRVLQHVTALGIDLLRGEEGRP